MKPALAGVKGAFWREDRYYGGTRLRGWVTAAIVTTVVVVGVCALTYGIVKTTRAAGAASCRTFASQSGYPSHFKIQHWLDAGTCYVRLPNGHALPQKMITAYLKANK